MFPKNPRKRLFVKLQVILPQKERIYGIYLFINGVIPVVLVNILPAHGAPTIFLPALSHLPPDFPGSIGLTTRNAVPEFRPKAPSLYLTVHAVWHFGSFF